MFEHPAVEESERSGRSRPRGWSIPHRWRVTGRALIAAISLLVLVGSGLAWATFENFKAEIPHGQPVPPLGPGEQDGDGADQNILLIGNDTRAGATSAELQAMHTGFDRSTANADTMMVLHVPSNGSRPTLVSFPRDSWVSIPGHGKGKINSAYPDGYNDAKAGGANEVAAESAGILLTLKTIHALTGLYIDHYMQVNLLGFYRISQAIGGVTVCLNAAQNANTDRDEFGRGYSGINLPKGVSVIEGEQALAFVRQRHGLPHGDLDRIKRQQYFLKAAFAKLTSAGELLNPFKFRDMLSAVGKSLLVDPQLDLLALARQFESLTSGNINFATIPNNGPQLIYPDGVATAIVAVDQGAIPSFVAGLEGRSDTAYQRARPAAPPTVTVDVLNGAGIPRLAARNADALRAKSFKVNTVDSAPGTTQATVIEYPAGQEAAAKALAGAVPQAKTALTPGLARVTLILGTDGRWVGGVAHPSGVKAGTAAPPPVDPTKGLGCID